MNATARTIVVLAAALLLAAPPASASHTKGRCGGGKTISQNSVARLYESGSSLLGCVWSRDERVDLDSEYDDGYTTAEGYDTPRLGGRFAAWSHYDTDLSCKADCPSGYDVTTYRVVRVDLRTGSETAVEGVPAGNTLRVNKRGAVTWLERLGGGRREVHAWDRDGHRVLDTGPIRTSSYSLRGSTLRWTNGDVSHVVTLR